MNPIKSDIELHVFVCTNQKPGGKTCCADKKGPAVRDSLKKKMATDYPELNGRVRINASGCLDHCTEGVACVVYPKGEWFVNMNEGDIDTFAQKIANMAKS